VGKGAIFAPCPPGKAKGGHAEPVIGPAQRVRPEPAIGPAKGRTRWAGPMTSSGRTRWLCPPYSAYILLERPPVVILLNLKEQP